MTELHGRKWRRVGAKHTVDGRATFLIAFHRIKPNQVAGAYRHGTLASLRQGKTATKDAQGFLRSDARRDRPMPFVRQSAQRPQQAAFRISRSGASGSPNMLGRAKIRHQLDLWTHHTSYRTQYGYAHEGRGTEFPQPRAGARKNPKCPATCPMRMMWPRPTGGRAPSSRRQRIQRRTDNPSSEAAPPPFPRPIPVPFPRPLPAANLRGPWLDCAYSRRTGPHPHRTGPSSIWCAPKPPTTANASTQPSNTARRSPSPASTGSPTASPPRSPPTASHPANGSWPSSATDPNSSSPSSAP